MKHLSIREILEISKNQVETKHKQQKETFLFRFIYFFVSIQAIYKMISNKYIFLDSEYLDKYYQESFTLYDILKGLYHTTKNEYLDDIRNGL